MTKEELQEKIDVVRDATQEGSVTNTQVAEIFTELNKRDGAESPLPQVTGSDFE